MVVGWHSHWSQDILRRLDLYDRPVTDVSRPELTVALLPPDRLERLGRHVGAALFAGRLRQTIAGDDVRRLSAEAGAEVLDFARQFVSVPPLSAAVATDSPISASLMGRWGNAALLGAMVGGGPELMRRFELKLPDDALSELPIDPATCLVIALDVLKLTDPTWLSSSLATR